MPNCSKLIWYKTHQIVNYSKLQRGKKGNLLSNTTKPLWTTDPTVKDGTIARASLYREAVMHNVDDFFVMGVDH